MSEPNLLAMEASRDPDEDDVAEDGPLEDLDFEVTLKLG